MAFEKLAPALAALLLGALAAGSVAFWALCAGAGGLPVAAEVAAAPLPSLEPQAVARALGAGGPGQPAQGAAPVAGPFRLQGVVVDGPERGAALIAAPGQLARPYRVGAALPGGWRLQAVARRSATLQAEDGRSATLHMPEPGSAAAHAAAAAPAPGGAAASPLASPLSPTLPSGPLPAAPLPLAQTPPQG
ncbi:MAG: type II secretion system protein N [Ottowia sp.]